jgi:hypothetical protein
MSRITDFPAFSEATNTWLAALAVQVNDPDDAPTPVTLPPRGVRQWVNLMVHMWSFAQRWRTHITGTAPASVQALFATLDILMPLIASMNTPGPE